MANCNHARCLRPETLHGMPPQTTHAVLTVGIVTRHVAAIVLALASLLLLLAAGVTLA